MFAGFGGLNINNEESSSEEEEEEEDKKEQENSEKENQISGDKEGLITISLENVLNWKDTSYVE